VHCDALGWLVGKSLTRFGSIGTCSGMVVGYLIYSLVGLGWSSSSVVLVISRIVYTSVVLQVYILYYRAV
jgi:hypothetical protein